MIRIRGGNFNYLSEEIEAMTEDVKYFKASGADGIVFGALDDNFNVDSESCEKIMKTWGREKPATFHRAFDEIIQGGIEIQREKFIENLKKIEDLGLKNIQEIIKHSKLTIMPGSGVNIDNVEEICKQTGCQEIHGSARREVNIETKLSLGGKKMMICDREKVESLVDALKML